MFITKRLICHELHGLHQSIQKMNLPRITMIVQLERQIENSHEFHKMHGLI